MIAIVDYQAGNLTSVQLAFQALGCSTTITSDPKTLLAADRVVFPGVGAAEAAMGNLEKFRLVDALKTITARGTPFLGICLGTQILFQFSEENDGIKTLGILRGTVKRFQPKDRADKVPEIGWNQVKIARKHPLLEGIEDESEFYFVHSYYPEPADPALTIGTTDYAGVTFSSMVGRGATVATQFHPEKSGRIGLRLLKNFITWDPAVRF